MANQYKQFGATVALGVGAVGAIKGIGALADSAKAGFVLNGGTTGNVSGGVTGAIDAMTSNAGGAASAALGAMGNVLTNPAFLTGVGMSLAGMALGSGFKRPSLNLPNVAALTAVALNVNNLIQQGKAAAAAYENLKTGMDITGAIGNAVNLQQSRADLLNNYVYESRAKTGTFRIKYPADLDSNYYIRFAIYDYSRLDLKNRNNDMRLPHTTIRLPLPNNLVDTINLAYSDVNMGQFGGAVYNALIPNGNSTTIANRTWQENVNAGVNGILKMMTNDPGFQQALMRRIASSVDPGLGTAFDITTGTAPNPHVVLAFNGIALKRFNFSWRFSPNSKAESEELEEIIRTFQLSSMPTKQGDFMLGYPNILKIDVSPTNLFVFKKMMIESVSVNYAPSGVPSFYADKDTTSVTPTVIVGGDDGEEDLNDAALGTRYPTEIILNITVKEIDIHTASDPEWVPFAPYRQETNVSLKPVSTEAPAGAETKPPVVRETTAPAGPTYDQLGNVIAP